MLTVLWFLAWILFGPATVQIDPLGGWAVTLIVFAVVDFTMAMRGDL